MFEPCNLCVFRRNPRVALRSRGQIVVFRGHEVWMMSSRPVQLAQVAERNVANRQVHTALKP